MARQNDVNSVLVTSGNQAVLGPGLTLDSLALGQIGVFDGQTNLSIDASANPREVFLAVGVDPSLTGSVSDIYQSAGRVIQPHNTEAYTFRSYSPGQNKVVTVSDYNADCDTDYAISIEFRNQEIYRTQGYNQFTKTYAVRTSCCTACDSCPSGDANDLTIKMVNAINADGENLVIAEAIARQDINITVDAVNIVYSEGDVMTLEDVQALLDFNALPTTVEADRVFSDIQLTILPLEVERYCNINLKYFNPLGTDAIVALVDGFGCSGVVETITPLLFEEGAGRMVKQLEYHSLGHSGQPGAPGPYRVNSLTWTAKEAFYITDDTAKYDLVYWAYGYIYRTSNAAMQNSNLSTTLAIPTADTTTKNGLFPILDNLIGGQGFDVLNDDQLASNTDEVTPEPTGEIDDPATDGIS